MSLQSHFTKYKELLQILLLTAFAVSMLACNSEFDKTLSEGPYSDSTTSVPKERKVLFLILDGARGWSVRDAGTSNIVSLLKNSTYSWNSLSDSLGNNGNGWADLMTGVTKNKHKVVDDSFNGNALTQYPGIIQRIKQLNPEIRITSFAASATFKDKLATEADLNQSYTSDAEVKAGLVSEISSGASSLIVGQFKSVDEAGVSGGYDNSNAPYKAAILKFDLYLGEMLSALRARKNYSKENWLVVITSSHGGQAAIPADLDDKTIFSYPKANTFTIIYNPAYKPFVLNKPFTGNKYAGKFLRLYSATADNTATVATSVRAEVTNNNNVYNFGDTVSFTVELKVKKNIRANSFRYEWPIFLSKRFNKTQKGGYGWGFGWEQDRWRFLVGKPEENHRFADGTNILDGNWHSLAAVVLNRDFKRVMRVYQDGKYVSETILPDNYGTFNSTAPLEMGFVPTDTKNPFDGFLSDIRIWKAALPDATIAQFACDTRIIESHPFWNRLIGYWPANDGEGMLMKDKSPAGNDFQISLGTGTTLQWTALNDVICPPPTGNLALTVPRTVDLPRQILSWFSIATPESWSLDGRVWINQ